MCFLNLTRIRCLLPLLGKAECLIVILFEEIATAKLQINNNMYYFIIWWFLPFTSMRFATCVTSESQFDSCIHTSTIFLFDWNSHLISKVLELMSFSKVFGTLYTQHDKSKWERQTTWICSLFFCLTFSDGKFPWYK